MRRNNLLRTLIIVVVIIWSLWQLYPTYQLANLKKQEASLIAQLTSLSGLSEKEINESLNSVLLDARLEQVISDPDSLAQAHSISERLLALEEKIAENELRSIKQGLDLLGGTYLVYEVDFPKLLEQTSTNADEEFEAIIAEVRDRSKSSDEDFFDILKAAFQSRGIRMSRYFPPRIKTDDEVIEELKKKAEDAVDRTLEVLRNRVDQFGVSEPSITKQGNRRIIIELPGIKDASRAKKIIGTTAQLDFKLVKDVAERNAVIQRIDRALKKRLSAKKPGSTADTTVTDNLKPRKDKPVGIDELLGTSTSDTSETDTSTVLADENLLNDRPFISLLAGVENDALLPAQNLKAVQRILKLPEIEKVIPKDSQFLFSADPIIINNQKYYTLYYVKKEPELTGAYLEEAYVSLSSGSQTYAQGQPQVDFKLNREGGRIFARVTGANVGKRLAIVLDNKVASAPNIKGKIPHGSAVIEGSFTMQEANDLAIVLRAGALPAPVKAIEERTVGASLGKDSVRQGQISLLLGISIVVIFMVVYYRLSGFIADFALIFNLLLIMAALAQFHATLTLPGVAGIILTMGMAVDANVLIFERIREELRTGKTVRAAIDAGYDRAFWTIFDANLTTFITALVLYQFGTGPIRGFAVTLSIGILASMFTAIVVTHVIFDFFTARKTIKKLSI